MNVKNIVIVGGGTAGWMSAVTILRTLPCMNVTLIESPNIKTIGVGESTLGQFRHWLSMVRIKDVDFMKECDAIYKFCIRFTNFYDYDSGHFDYPFGKPFLTHEHGLNLWYIKKILYPKIKNNDYVDSFYPIMSLINNNRVYTQDKLKNFNFNKDTAFQFDATKFGLWLRDNICLPEGVTHIKSEIKNITVNDNGINYLELDNGQIIKGDLFIDCSGFKSLLIGKTLNEEYISYEKIIHNNKAWATHIEYKDKDKEMVGFTNCTAINNGWVWNIPLYSKIGTGYIYSDKYINDKNALSEFKDFLILNGHDISKCVFTHIPIRVGIYKRLFVKNVCAIGLSAGFIEPLESNGLFMVHDFLFNLIDVLQRGKISQFDRDSFTYTCRQIYSNWVEFIALHYALSSRDDTDYWKNINNTVYDSELYNLTPTSTIGFADAIVSKMTNNKMNRDGGLHCIAVGMNWFPLNDLIIKYSEKESNTSYDTYKPILENVDNNIKEWDLITSHCPTLYEFMKNIYESK